MRCCVDLIKFLLFFANLMAFICFILLDTGCIYALLNGEETFVGMHIEPSLSESNPTAIYFTLFIIMIVICSFFIIFTCLGCLGTACKSSCMIGSFIVIEFVLFGGSVGAVIFIHVTYGADGVQEILAQELKRAVSFYEESKLVQAYMDHFLREAQCCGIGDKGIGPWAETKLPSGYRVPEACCKPNYPECMYEPTWENVGGDCVYTVLPYLQILVYGLPVLMFVSLVFAFIVTSSFTQRTRRKEERPYHSHSQYSIGAEDEFQTNYTAPAAPMGGGPATAPTYDNSPYNPQYEMQNYRNVGNYPTGPAPPPGHAHTPLLHQPPPPYNEAIHYGRPGKSYDR